MKEIKADPELLKTQVYNYYKHKDDGDDELSYFCFESDYYTVTVKYNYVANGLNSETLKEDLGRLEELLDDYDFKMKTACIEDEIRGKVLKVDTENYKIHTSIDDELITVNKKDIKIVF